jgi:hypothetical protein
MLGGTRGWRIVFMTPRQSHFRGTKEFYFSGMGAHANMLRIIDKGDDDDTSV